MPMEKSKFMKLILIISQNFPKLFKSLIKVFEHQKIIERGKSEINLTELRQVFMDQKISLEYFLNLLFF